MLGTCFFSGPPAYCRHASMLACLVVESCGHLGVLVRWSIMCAHQKCANSLRCCSKLYKGSHISMLQSRINNNIDSINSRVSTFCATEQPGNMPASGMVDARQCVSGCRYSMRNLFVVASRRFMKNPATPACSFEHNAAPPPCTMHRGGRTACMEWSEISDMFMKPTVITCFSCTATIIVALYESSRL